MTLLNYIDNPETRYRLMSGFNYRKGYVLVTSGYIWVTFLKTEITKYINYLHKWLHFLHYFEGTYIIIEMIIDVTQEGAKMRGGYMLFYVENVTFIYLHR